MKVECSCGVKYEFEIRPEMRERPVAFVCPACGLDASAFVDGLIRRELGQSVTPSGTPVPALSASPAPTGPGSSPPMDTPPIPSLRLARASNTRGGQATPADSPGATACAKHPGNLASSKCYICSKPICAKCMELFGYVCSPLCKAKAEAQGIHVPVYAGQKARVEARRWRALVYTSSGIAILLVLFFGLWGWYAWFGCQPKSIFSVRFPDPAYSGRSALAGKNRDQLVFLHGAVLARYDLNTGKEIWSRRIVDQSVIDRAVARQIQATQAIINKANNEAWEQVPKMPSADSLARTMEREVTSTLNLLVRGESIWLISPEKVSQYDWQTGNSLHELPVQPGFGEGLARGDELLFVGNESGKPVANHINLVTGATRTEAVSESDAKLLTEQPGKTASSAKTGSSAGGNSVTGRIPTATANSGTAMDPAKVAAQAQRMSLPEKIALPAVLAGNMNQQRALNQLDDPGRAAAATKSSLEPSAGFSLIPDNDGFLEFSVKLLESRITTRSAVKPGSGKSVLEGDVTAGKSMEMSNGLLNEMQRENGGDLVQEDHSRYQVTVRRPGSSAGWSSEVVGPPNLYPLDSVTVATAEKQIIVLDKENKKLWQSGLNYNVVGALASMDQGTAVYGEGPCVERKGTLYVFDQGVLSAFELKTGNARWRLPTVGIAGLFFDDHDMLYVNTTSAAHDSLKYSRQIDLSQKVSSIILKLDSRDGKILWSAESEGLVNYVSGKIILVTQLSIPPEDDGMETGLERQPSTRIRRLNPRNGREVWEYYQDRVPLDIAFGDGTIRLVFKKEVQVLRFPRL